MHGSLHHDPPHTPHSVLTRHHLGWAVAGLALTLGVLAAIDDSSALLRWDRPIQEWVVANRTPWLEAVFRGFSRMGSNVVVFAVFAVVVALTSRRCRSLAAATAALLIAGIAASRIYFGVHWFSDIVQGLLLGWLYLAFIEQLFAHHHRHGSCGLTPPGRGS